MSGGSGNYHLPTSTTTTTQQPQRFQFLSKLRNQRQQQQQVVPTTTMPGRGVCAGAGEARASGENNNNNNGIGHSNGLPALPTSRRQQQQHSSSLCTTDAPADHYYSQPMPIAPPSRPQRGSRASNGQHSIAYAGEHSPQQRHQQQPVVASSAANRRTEVASYARSQQQQQQVYAAMSHTNGGHYEPQQQQQHRSSRHYQQMQGQFQLGNNSVTQLNGSKTGSYSTGNDDAGRAPVESGEFVLSAYDDEDDEADQHYAAQLRRAQMQQQPMGATCKQQRARECHDHDNHRRHHNHIHNHQNHAEQNNHRLDQSGSATAAAAAAASETQQQQQPIAAGDNTQRQHQAHSPRESLHVNFNRSSQRAGGGGVGQGEDEEGAESTRKKKYLTAKYGQQQMNLIKKRLKIEMWLHEQLQQLAAQSKSGVDPDELDEIDIDLDQLLDMEDDATRRNWLVKTLEPFGELPRDALEKFICDVLEQSKLL